MAFCWSESVKVFLNYSLWGRTVHLQATPRSERRTTLTSLCHGEAASAASSQGRLDRLDRLDRHVPALQFAAKWCPSAQLGILHRRCSWRYQGQRVGVLSVNTANLDEPVMLRGKILCFFAFPVSNSNSKVWFTVADVACVALLKASLVASLICTLPGFLLQLLAYPLTEL